MPVVPLAPCSGSIPGYMSPHESNRERARGVRQHPEGENLGWLGGVSVVAMGDDTRGGAAFPMDLEALLLNGSWESEGAPADPSAHRVDR